MFVLIILNKKLYSYENILKLKTIGASYNNLAMIIIIIIIIIRDHYIKLFKKIEKCGIIVNLISN